MSLYISAAKYNLRFNLLPHIAAAVGLLLLTPVVFGITALDSMSAALPLELSLPFLGVILLTPVYSFEQDSGILDTVAARKTPYLQICGIRILLGAVLMLFFACGFVGLMAALECEVTLAHALASYANAVFLGGMGLLGASLSENTVIGYMAAILYFVLDLMGGLTPFTLFSMMRSGTAEGKWILFAVGIACLAASLWGRNFSMKQK